MNLDLQKCIKGSEDRAGVKHTHTNSKNLKSFESVEGSKIAFQIRRKKNALTNHGIISTGVCTRPISHVINHSDLGDKLDSNSKNSGYRKLHQTER